MVKVYIIVQDNSLEKLINEVNEQMIINKGEPLGGIIMTMGKYTQAMMIGVKTNDDEVLPEAVKLIDIYIDMVRRTPVENDPFQQTMIITYTYKEKKHTLEVDNFDCDDIVKTKIKVQEHLQANYK